MGIVKDKIASILYPPGTTRLDPKVSAALVLILVCFLFNSSTFFIRTPTILLSTSVNRNVNFSFTTLNGNPALSTVATMSMNFPF